jgi:uncharacterized protein
MEKITGSVQEFFSRVPDVLRRRKWLFSLFFLAATVFLFMGMGRSKFDLTVEGWFAKDDPVLVALNGFHAKFGSEDHIFIAYKPKDGDLFSKQSLEALKGITDELLDRDAPGPRNPEDSILGHIVKITSLVNASVLEAEGDALISRPLVGNVIPSSPEELAKIRATAASQKNFPLLYYSKDMKYGGILIETDFGAIPVNEPSGDKDLELANALEAPVAGAAAAGAVEEPIKFKPVDLAEYDALWKRIKPVLDKPQFAGSLEYHPIGNPPSVQYDLAMLNEMGMLYVAALFIMAVLLWFFFRSLSAVVWILAIVVLSTIWTMGINGWMGHTVSGFIILTLMLLLTIGMADAIHILSGYLFYRNEGLDHRAAMRETYLRAGIACALTAVTTIIGIGSLWLAQIVPVRNFAVMSSVGVIVAYFLTMFMLPLLLDLWAPKPMYARAMKGGWVGLALPNFSRFLQARLDRVIPMVQKGPLAYVAAFLALFLVCAYGALKVRVDTYPLSQYPKDAPIRESVRLVDKNMMGAQNMELYVDLGRPDAFQDPYVLQAIDGLQARLKQKHPEVLRVSSLVNVVKESYQKLNEGKEEMYAVPSDPRVLSQTLFLFNNANVDDRRKLVSDDYRQSHISVQTHSLGSYESKRLIGRMQGDIDATVADLKQKYPEARISITGIFALMMKGADYMTEAEVSSFGTALVVITVVLLLVFGSLKAGLIAILPNLIPSMLTFGLLGLLGIPLDFTTMMIAPIVIGIAVDDTVHFISQYQTNVMREGDIVKALRATVKECGQSIAFASLVMGIGFGIMAIAQAPNTSNLGKFTFLSVMAGLLNDLFLLPALILTFKLDFKGRKPAAVPAGSGMAKQMAFSEDMK